MFFFQKMEYVVDYFKNREIILFDFVLKWWQKNKTEDRYIPDISNRFNAFKGWESLDQIKVVFLGQDPYPRKKSACGLSFLDT